MLNVPCVGYRDDQTAHSLLAQPRDDTLWVGNVLEDLRDDHPVKGLRQMKAFGSDVPHDTVRSLGSGCRYPAFGDINPPARSVLRPRKKAQQ